MSRTSNDAAFHPAWAAALLDLAEWLDDDAAAEAATQATDLYRALAELDPQRYLPDLAATLLRLGRCTRPVAAASVVNESVDVYRRLCRVDPVRFQPAFADALAEQVRTVDRMGRPDLAITAAEEIVRVFSSLSMTRPAAYLSLHAAALDALADRCAEQGESAIALTASESAVAVHRRLASERPDPCLAGLADALRRLSERLGSSGWVEQARVVSSEAITWCRILDLRASQHRARLASALCTHAAWLGSLGNWADCWSAFQEAVDLYRQLRTDQPGQHAIELAAASVNLAVSLGEQYRVTESLSAAQEAVDLYHRLDSEQPGSYEAGLAVALTNLAVSLGENLRHDAGVAAGAEAVARLRSLASAAGYEHELAAAQLALGRQLGALGTYELAAEATAQAIRILRELANDGDLTGSLTFAMSASYLAEILTTTGQYEDGLARAGEALAVFRQLAADRPQRLSPGMAGALLSLSECQARLGLAEQARSCAEKGVAQRRLLAEAEPGAFAGPLAEALCVLSARLEEGGESALANQNKAEAVELYQNLTGMQAIKYQHALVMALCEHATGLARSGGDESVAVATEAVRRAGEPGADGDTTILPLDEAEALATLAECLEVRRQWAASRSAARNVAESCVRDVQFSAAEPDFGASARIHLADRLSTLARRLYDLNALSDSLDVVGLAERLWDSIDDPSADVRYGLARSLELSSAVLRELPRRRDAARAAEEAVALYRGLATEDPGQFLGQLAHALGTLARSQRGAKARRLRGEAEAIRNATPKDPGY